MAGALDRVRVIEFGSFLAVPAACALLADWGADVIKVEPLGGDTMRGVRFVQNVAMPPRCPPHLEVGNRNKRSIALDVKRAAAKDVLMRLVKGADVFITNQRPSLLDEIGATYEHLRAVNDRLIYASLTGYGRRGPDKDKQGFDRMAYWVRSGLMRRHAAGMPYPPDLATGMGDMTASLGAAAAMAAALFARERTGVGQEIDLSLYHTGLWVLQMDLQIQLSLGEEVVALPRTKAPNPLVNYYRAMDDRWIVLSMSVSDPLWPALCHALELTELVDDPRYASMDARRQNCETLIATLDCVFATRTAEEWNGILAEHGLRFELAQTTADVATDPQAWENGFLLKTEHPVLGEMTTIASPAGFHGTPATVRSPAPEVGQHTEAVLGELGYSWDEIHVLREQRAIL